MAKILDLAKAYIAAGIKCHPVHPPTFKDKKRAGKSPKTSKWSTRFLTAEEFEENYKEGDNLGVVTGKVSGLICIDIDPRNGGQGWYDKNDHRLGRGIHETTGGGGIHLYYIYPAAIPFINSYTGIFPGVDILADGGHQVVTAPSVHSSGGDYKTHNGLTLLDLPTEGEEVPQWLLDIICQAVPVRVDTLAPEIITDIADVLSVAADIARALPAAIEGQSGDLVTFAAAARMRDYGLAPDAAFKILLENFNPRCSPPWAPQALHAKVLNAYKYAKGVAGGALPAAQFEEEPEPAPPVMAESKTGVGYKTKGPCIPSALAFIERHKGMLRFCESQGYAYNQGRHCWEMMSRVAFRALVWEDIKVTSPVMFAKFSMPRFYTICSIIEQELQSESFKGIPDTWADGRAGDYIALQNGILHIQSLILCPHSPEWFSYTTLPFAYDADQQCDKFLEFLKEIWDGDANLFDSFAKWMGYLLLRDNSQQKFALFIGESRAGKSTIARVLEQLIGESNKVACSLEALGGDFGMAPLLGKRLAVFSDAYRVSGSLGEISTGRLVSIVGNDPQQVNRKGLASIDVLLGCKILVICNDIPNFGNAQNQMTNRMIVFPFKKSFAGREDVALGETLSKELPGIFNLALLGARALIAGGRLEQSEQGKVALAEIGETLDPAIAFFNENLAVTGRKSDFLESQRIYDVYKAWCNDSGHLPKSKINFSRSISRCVREGGGFEKRWLHDKHVRGIWGVIINDRHSPVEF